VLVAQIALSQEDSGFYFTFFYFFNKSFEKTSAFKTKMIHFSQEEEVLMATAALS